MRRLATVGVGAWLLWSCATTATPEPEAPPTGRAAGRPERAPAARPPPVEVPVHAEARIDPVDGSGVSGFGQFAVEHGVVTMNLVFHGVPAGTHALQLQEGCEGLHWNPNAARHGRFDVPPFHLGDVGNFFADQDGNGSLIFTTELWSVDTGLPNDVVGKVIAVRERRDDFSTAPNGNAGRVLGCGRIEPAQLTMPAVSVTGRLIEPLK